MPELPAKLRIKLFVSGTNTLIGSDSKNEPGNYISKDTFFRLALPVNRRNKNLADMIISLFFLISFPIHFLIKSKPLSFFKNVFSVLFLRKTWIGYAVCEKKLPPLKQGILTTTGLPARLNTLADESLYNTDILYAKNFHILNDIKMVWLNYKLLS